MDISKYHCSSEDKARLPDYEYAREADAYRVQFPSAPTWQRVFVDQFPKTLFDLSDESLKQEFVQMLASIRRRKKPKPSKHNEVDAKLTRLAATRLYRFFRSVEKAGAFAIKHGFDCPCAGDDGWSRARTEVWSVLGVHDFPPDDAS